MTVLKLTWADLLIEDPRDEELEEWLAPWSGSVHDSFAVAFLNKFGSWFLRRPEGPVDMLDVFTGQVERVAESFAAFQQEVNERSWQEVYLASKLVYRMHEEGKIPGPGECYAIAPHPALGGPNPMASQDVEPRHVSVMSMGVWQSLCAQSLRVTGPA